jgi:hypothetical protein
LGAKTLVSSDKTPRILDRFDPEHNFDLIAIFKDPVRQYGSYKRVMEKQGQPYTVQGYLRSWANLYSKILNYQVKGRIIAIDSVKFQENPRGCLRSVCDALSLPFSEAALTYWEADHHTIGGNFNPYTRLKSDPENMPVRPQSPFPISEAERSEIDADDTVRALTSQLVECEALYRTY